MPRLGIAAFAFLALVSHATAQPINRADVKPGLVFAATDSAGTTVSRLEPAVALTLASGEAAHPRLGTGDSFRWTGTINVTIPGKYKFDAVLLGKLAVSIGGKAVFSGEAAGKDPAAAQLVAGQEVELAGGIQVFEATLTRTGDAARVELVWKGPGFYKPEPVPYFFFGHLPKQLPGSFAGDVARERGRLLFEELSCAKCHAPDAGDKAAKTLVERTGPNLSDIGRRAYPGWLDAWLADPQHLRPNSVMPKMFADDATGKAERHAVVAYLTGLGGPPVVNDKADTRQIGKSLNDGKKLYLTAGCAACHGDKLMEPPSKKKLNDDEDEKPVAKPEDSYLPGGPLSYYRLGAVGSKFTPDALAKFLLNPLATNPHGRMPSLVLTSQEATDLARYLCTATDPKIAKEPEKADETGLIALAEKLVPAAESKKFEGLKPVEQWKDLGKRLVVSKGCVNCHTLEPGGKAVKATAKFESLAEAKKAPEKGCLAAKPTPGTAPVYPLDADQKAALAAFLTDGLTGPGTPSPAYAARIAMKRFNCLNCHTRDGEGGIDEALADQMKALEKTENADDVQPPRLSGVGHKLKPSWSKQVLTQAGRARPWMGLRMPQYGEPNVGFLPDALPKLEGTVADDGPKSAPGKGDQIAVGRTLAGKNGLGCVACHDISGVSGGGTRGPDLALMTPRLRKDWYDRWMHQPQRIAPGTRMPQNFLDGKSQLTAILAGDGDAQVDALWAYLALGPGLPLPAGMEPPKGVVVAVKDRPELMRTFMPDAAGTKPIAVGYPGGVSLVFDTAQARLGYGWNGNFLDMTTVWTNRGGNPAKLLGPKFWTAPPGNPWAITDSRTAPDFAKRSTDPAYGHQLPNDEAYTGNRFLKFTGYALDPAGNPSFKYELLDETASTPTVALKVAEKPLPLPVTVAAGLSRSFAVELPAKKTTWFLAANGTGEPRVTNAAGEKVAVDFKAAEIETPALGSRVVIPDGTRATVLELASAPAGTAWRFEPKKGGGWSAILRFPETETASKADVVLNLWGLSKDDEDLLKGLKK